MQNIASPKCSSKQSENSSVLNHVSWAIRGLFFVIFFFSIQLTVNIQYKFWQWLTGFESQTSVVGSNRSTKWPNEPQPLPNVIFNLQLRIWRAPFPSSPKTLFFDLYSCFTFFLLHFDCVSLSKIVWTSTMT